MFTAMWYAAAALGALVVLVMSGRLIARRLPGHSFPSAQALARERSLAATLAAEPCSAVVKPIPQPRLRPAPGAPNTDPPTDRHISERGTATIRKRTGRRRSTTDTLSRTSPQ
jgi:hypothetical protein